MSISVMDFALIVLDRTGHTFLAEDVPVMFDNCSENRVLEVG